MKVFVVYRIHEEHDSGDIFSSRLLAEQHVVRLSRPFCGLSEGGFILVETDIDIPPPMESRFCWKSRCVIAKGDVSAIERDSECLSADAGEKTFSYWTYDEKVEETYYFASLSFESRDRADEAIFYEIKHFLRVKAWAKRDLRSENKYEFMPPHYGLDLKHPEDDR